MIKNNDKCVTLRNHCSRFKRVHTIPCFGCWCSWAEL